MIGASRLELSLSFFCAGLNVHAAEKFVPDMVLWGGMSLTVVIMAVWSTLLEEKH